MIKPPMIDDLLTVNEAVARLGVQRARLYRMMAEGLLPYRVRFGKRLFRREDVERLNRDGWAGRGRGRGRSRVARGPESVS